MEDMQITDEKNMTEWTTVIRPATNRFDFSLSELWRYRDLVLLFVRRDFVAVYSQTILGPLWFFIQPLLTTLVFTVIFGKLAHIPTDKLPPILFYLSGIILWNYFANCLQSTSNTFVNNASIFGKVYFPRLAVPISVVISNLVTFAIQFSLFLVIFVYLLAKGAPVYPNAWVFLLPFIVVQLAALGLGFGIIVSSLTTRYRDLSYLVSFGIQLWMFATPVVYPASSLPGEWCWLLVVNPMASAIEVFRYAFLGAGTISAPMILSGIAVTLFVLAVGIFLFNSIEKSFMDTV